MLVEWIRRVLQRLRTRVRAPDRVVSMQAARWLRMDRRGWQQRYEREHGRDRDDARAVRVDVLDRDVTRTCPDGVVPVAGARTNVVVVGAQGVQLAAAAIDLREVLAAQGDALSADLPSRRRQLWLQGRGSARGDVSSRVTSVSCPRCGA